MSHRHLSRALVAAGLAVPGAPVAVWAQPPGIVALASNCHVVVQTNGLGAVTHLQVNKDVIDLNAATAGPVTTVSPIGRRLRIGDKVGVTVAGTAVNKTVGINPMPQADPFCPTVVRSMDDREDFEAHAFLGWSFDNFAPTAGETLAYDAANAGASPKYRFIGGINSQVRLLGNAEGGVQVWASGWGLMGMRSADVECTPVSTQATAGTASAVEQAPEQSPLCNPSSANISKQLFTILEHASTLETHVELRQEWFRWRSDSTTPLRLFTFQRLGFVGIRRDERLIEAANEAALRRAEAVGGNLPVIPPKVISEPKLYDTDSIGAGIVVPTGRFRWSSWTIAMGRTQMFESDPGWGRIKTNALLIVDVAPGLKDKAFLSYLGFGSLRMFVDVAIDRRYAWTKRGPVDASHARTGPDSVQAYVGFAFDMAKAFTP